MKNFWGPIIGVIAIITATFATLGFLDKRYVLKDEKIPVLSELPVGTIVAWRGNGSTELPDDWTRCDGTSKACPDLRGKFLRGEHPDYAEFGGRPLHTIEDQDIQVFGSGWDQERMSDHPAGGPEKNQGWGSRNWHILISKGKVHGEKVDLIPPYHAFTFIMKVKGG